MYKKKNLNIKILLKTIHYDNVYSILNLLFLKLMVHLVLILYSFNRKINLIDKNQKFKISINSLQNTNKNIKISFVEILYYVLNKYYTVL